MNTSLKKVIWIILLSVLVLSTVLALLQRHRASRMQHVAADIRRAMREQGFKTDLADFNFTADAATRLRTEALSFGWSVPELSTNEDELELLPAVSNDTATVIWKQDSLKFWKKRRDWDPFSWQLASNNLHWSDLHAMLDTNRWLLDMACAAALAGPIRFDAEATNGTDMFRLQVEELSLPSLSLALYRCAMLDLHDGNPDAAWTNLLAATRLVTASVPEPTVDSQCLHLKIAGAAFADTWQVLQKGNWPDEELAVLQQEWESVNFFTNVAETAAIAHAMDVFYCQEESRGPWFLPFSFSRLGNEALVRLSDGHEYIRDHVALGIYRHYGVFADEKGLMLYFQNRALELRRAVEATNWAEMRALPGVTNVVPFKSSYPPAMGDLEYNHRLDNALLPLVAGAEARRRVLITVLALERYRGKHGAYPATLAPLAPEFLKAVPVDFMDGQPLRYRLTVDGQFVLYSVGLDCVDDGGMMSDPSSPLWIRAVLENPSGPTNVDIVWPRPDTGRTQTLKGP